LLRFDFRITYFKWKSTQSVVGQGPVLAVRESRNQAKAFRFDFTQRFMKFWLEWRSVPVCRRRDSCNANYRRLLYDLAALSAVAGSRNLQ
jgi:hypothetical protein